MVRAAWAVDLSATELGSERAELPKPPGYSEQHMHEQDDKVAVRKVDMMQLKLKVRGAPATQRGFLLAATLAVPPTGRRRARWVGHPARIS